MKGYFMLFYRLTTAVIHGHFLAFTAVSSRSPSEESCVGTYAYLESLRILSLLRKESLLDGFLCYKFRYRHRVI